MSADQWFTLVRFRDDPQHLTGVSQARTAQEALDQLTAWDEAYPAETTIVFDPEQHPLDRPVLLERAAGLHPAEDRPTQVAD
jgi:hypothetical protein